MIEAVKNQHLDQVWKSLSAESQKRLDQKASLMGKKDGVSFFKKATLFPSVRLHLSIKKQPQQKGNRTLLFYRDELDQPVEIVMRKEDGSWKYVLQGNWLSPKEIKKVHATPKTLKSLKQPAQETPASQSATLKAKKHRVTPPTSEPSPSIGKPASKDPSFR